MRGKLLFKIHGSIPTRVIMPPCLPCDGIRTNGSKIGLIHDSSKVQPPVSTGALFIGVGIVNTKQVQ